MMRSFYLQCTASIYYGYVCVCVCLCVCVSVCVYLCSSMIVCLCVFFCLSHVRSVYLYTRVSNWKGKRKNEKQLKTTSSFTKIENSISSVVIEIFSFRQKKLTTFHPVVLVAPQTLRSSVLKEGMRVQQKSGSRDFKGQSNKNLYHL